MLDGRLEKTVLNGSLLYRWEGKDTAKLPILLMGHQDVVPANDEGWSSPAFGGEIREEPVLMGTLNFLQDMGVEIPDGTMVNQALKSADLLAQKGRYYELYTGQKELD